MYCEREQYSRRKRERERTRAREQERERERRKEMVDEPFRFTKIVIASFAQPNYDENTLEIAVITRLLIRGY